jgi:hypothetical protein
MIQLQISAPSRRIDNLPELPFPEPVKKSKGAFLPALSDFGT